MREDLPDISFERSMNHNYIVLSKCNFFGKCGEKKTDYRTKMLLENHIPGLLPVTHRQVNGESKFYYEINSLQSLNRLYDKSEVRYDDLTKLLSGCVNLFNRLEDYLLDGAQIIIKPELIYVDVEKMEPYFICYPEYEGDVRLSFMEFIDEILTKIDHTDERAVMLGYQIYRYTRNPNYVISEIEKMMEQVIVNIVQKKEYAMETFANNCTPITKETKDNLMFDRDNNVSSHFYEVPEEKLQETTEKENTQPNKYITDLVGGIFCVFIVLCASTILLAARVLHSIQLSRNNEFYLYGATGMAATAAVLFFFCFFKKRNKTAVNTRIDADCSKEDIEDQYAYFSSVPEIQQDDDTKVKYNKLSYPSSCGETMYLGADIMEERMLCGKLNGKEVHISLDTLPMTVGKLASVSDLVLDDTAVSKMHARFEEHDGKIYLCDLNSTNGTVHNGVMLEVNQSVALEPGDKLRFGRTCFTYS